jgi:glycosyltransferase involved in cell wall biosynthesis
VTVVAPTVGANAFLPGGKLRNAVQPGDSTLPGITFERVHVPSLQESRLPLPGVVAKADQKLRFAVLYPYLASRRAERVLRQTPVDVVYAYEVHGALAARRLRRWRLPTVARFQGTVMYPALSHPVTRLRKYEEVLALRLPADVYIMTDDGTRGDDVLARLNPGVMPKLRFWRNGLDMERLRPATVAERAARRRDLVLPEDAFVLMTASRLAAWKRVDRAVAAMPEIVRNEPHALLVIVGEGEERANLESRALELGVRDYVRFVGAVPQDLVRDYMQAADVLLAVADLSNVGNPLLEAMACGLAIVSVDAGDTRDLIHDGETGRLLPDGDAAAIAKAVIELGADVPHRCALAAGARRFAEEHFWTWEERLQAELDVVEGLVARRGD